MNIPRILAVVIVLLSPLAAQAQYDYQKLNYPGATTTQLFGINDRGDVVGNGIIDPDTFPFVYRLKKGTFTVVEPLDSYLTAVVGINGRGDIVGSVSDGNRRSGFINDKKGNFSVFDHPDAISFTVFRGVNNGGLVTGYRDDNNGDFVGFIYDSKSGTFIDLIPTKSFFTIAHGINQKGEVVGDSRFYDANDPCPDLGNSGYSIPKYGWLRATDGNVTYFEVNGFRTAARGITDEGLIVGYFTDVNDGYKTKGFITELEAGPPCQSITVASDDAIEFSEAALTIPEGINKNGDIVGTYSTDQTDQHGFIATPQ
jgi:uncharacterized membrane protein